MVRYIRPEHITTEGDKIVWWQIDCATGQKLSHDYEAPATVTKSYKHMIPNRAFGAKYVPGTVLPNGDVISYGDSKYRLRRELHHRLYLLSDLATLSGRIRAHNGWCGFSPEHHSPYDPMGDVFGMLLDLEYQVMDWDAAVATAVGNLRNQFSLINFILEMDEIPRLFDRCRTFCEGYLRGQFGALPLISDIENYFRYQLEADQLLAEVIQKLREGETFGRQLSDYKSVSKVLHRAGRTYEVKIYGKLTQAVSGVVRGTVETSAWRSYADMIGLYPDLSTLWNALPFTFVIDYFIPVGDALASQDEGWNRRHMSIDPQTAMTSVKFDGHFSVTCIDVPGCSQHPEIGVMTHKGSFKDYVRVFALDCPLDGIDVSATAPNLSNTQMANLTALAREGRRRNARPFQFRF